jgi:vesicle coat complex subunit
MYKVNTKKMFVDIAADFAIIINSATGTCYGISYFGTTVFQNLIKGTAVSEILLALKAIPDVPADIEQRLTAFLKELKEKEIIIEGDTIKNEVNIKAELATTDNFTFKLMEYTDAQKMLSADPIHDVEEDLGWQPFFKENIES